MTKLEKRKTRLVFQTADEIREQGKHRQVIVEAHAGYCTVRLAGLRRGYDISYGAIFHQAVKMSVAADRAAKKAGRLCGSQ